MNVLVLVPFCEEHMERIREAAGPGAQVTHYTDKWEGRTKPTGASVLPVALRKNGPAPLADPLREALSQADVVIGEPHPRLISADMPLKWVQMTWAGSDLYTKGRGWLPEGVMLTNVAGAAYGHIVSQYVVGQILALAQNLAIYALQMQTRSWNDFGEVFSLEGANVLVYGAGDIGSYVARRLQGFDVGRIVGVCQNVDEPREGFDKLVKLNRAEFELPEADVVVGCLPSSPATAGYFNERRLHLLKEGSMLVNVGRGDFIDLDELNAVLNEGRLRGAALDVTDPEPLPIKHELWRNWRCIITPHVSGGNFGKCAGTEERICEVVCENLRRYVAGEELLHRVY